MSATRVPGYLAGTQVTDMEMGKKTTRVTISITNTDYHSSLSRQTSFNLTQSVTGKLTNRRTAILNLPPYRPEAQQSTTYKAEKKNMFLHFSCAICKFINQV